MKTALLLGGTTAYLDSNTIATHGPPHNTKYVGVEADRVQRLNPRKPVPHQTKASIPYPKVKAPDERPI